MDENVSVKRDDKERADFEKWFAAQPREWQHVRFVAVESMFSAWLACSASTAPASPPSSVGEGACHGLDTPERICFYEQDFYVLSNFSSFRVRYRGIDFDTSEHAYHWAKFDGQASHHPEIQRLIRQARSAHDAFKIAEQYKASRRVDWDRVKLNIMRSILIAKANQHEYVKRKLLATGDRELVENSWRDDFWGWGPNRDGQNMLGKLWMQVRDELRSLLQEDAKR